MNTNQVHYFIIWNTFYFQSEYTHLIVSFYQNKNMTVTPIFINKHINTITKQPEWVCCVGIFAEFGMAEDHLSLVYTYKKFKLRD